jgi:predicted DNA-binding protein
MSSQMTIRIDPEIKKRFSKLVRAEGKSPGQALREPIENCIKERVTRTYIDDLWKRIGSKLESKDLKQRDINRVIKEARKASR